MKKVQVRAENGIFILSARGYLEQEFKQNLVTFQLNHSHISKLQVILDFSRADIMNSHGVSGIQDLRNMVNDSGGTFALCAVQNHDLQHILATTGILKACHPNIYETQVAAIKAVS